MGSKGRANGPLTSADSPIDTEVTRKFRSIFEKLNKPSFRAIEFSGQLEVRCLAKMNMKIVLRVFMAAPICSKPLLLGWSGPFADLLGWAKSPEQIAAQDLADVGFGIVAIE